MLLLDTVVLIWMSEGLPLLESARLALRKAEADNEPLVVSATTAWEACLLERRTRTGPSVGGDGEAWFNSAVVRFGLTVIPINETIAIASRRLPEPFHQDPGDRFIVATARIFDIPVITSDRDILDYAALGHVRAIAC
jgi:PIN domain nuclease of toxin-antitoxin system